MSRHKKGAHGGDHGGGMERWLLTYADMITLLLALFVILFALSTINAKKFKLFEAGLHAAFNNTALKSNSGGSGLLPKSNSLASNSKLSTNPVATTTQTTTGKETSLDKIAASVTSALSAAGLSQYATTRLEKQGVVVQMLADKTYFASDSATLGIVGDKVVDTIASVVKKIPNDVEVQGYTDNIPVLGGTYSSNWELSAVRAVNVVRRLATTDGITKSRLSATGFGTTRPLQPNSSTANRAANRRVDVVILTSTLGTSSTSTTSTGSGSTSPTVSTTPGPSSTSTTGPSVPSTTPTTASPSSTSTTPTTAVASGTSESSTKTTKSDSSTKTTKSASSAKSSKPASSTTSTTSSPSTTSTTPTTSVQSNTSNVPNSSSAGGAAK